MNARRRARRLPVSTMRSSERHSNETSRSSPDRPRDRGCCSGEGGSRAEVREPRLGLARFVSGRTGRVAGSFDQLVIGIADAADAGAVAQLRSQWSVDVDADAMFERRMAEWPVGERERRTTWLARIKGVPVGMALMLEYRRMPHPDRPDSRWDYISNMFVRPEHRGHGIGSATAPRVDLGRARPGVCEARAVSERAVDGLLRAGRLHLG